MNSARGHEQLYQQGTALLEAGKTAEACQRLEASQKFDSGVGTLLMLAHCYERLGKPASAWGRFLEAEALAQKADDLERARVARVRANRLEPLLPQLVLRFDPGTQVEKLEILLSDVLVPSEAATLPLPIDPGLQTVRIRAD